ANCFIADGVEVGDRTRMMLNVGIGRCTKIGTDVYIGPNVVFANSDPRDGRILPVEIGNGAVIGTNAVTTHKVRRIGTDATVGAGSVVTKDVPDRAVVAGNPARIIGWNTIDGEEPK
ncbi:MAG: LbetaH domain-containing protein, partial [Planctomycetota bacterium]